MRVIIAANRHSEMAQKLLRDLIAYILKALIYASCSALDATNRNNKRILVLKIYLFAFSCLIVIDFIMRTFV